MGFGETWSGHLREDRDESEWISDPISGSSVCEETKDRYD
jgi:hypothetical protein